MVPGEGHYVVTHGSALLTRVSAVRRVPLAHDERVGALPGESDLPFCERVGRLPSVGHEVGIVSDESVIGVGSRVCGRTGLSGTAGS
jgi:hypothetical protein